MLNATSLPPLTFMVGARLTNLRAQTLEDLSGKPSNQPIQTMDEPTTQCLCQWQRLGQRHVSVIRIAEENAKELGLEFTMSSAMFQGREILANLAWLYMIIAHAPATIDRCIAIPNRRPPRDWHDVEMSGYLDFQEANDTRILMSKLKCRKKKRFQLTRSFPASSRPSQPAGFTTTTIKSSFFRS